jgi:response regulator RpfG family c-di-GMP phosphodiesterase
VRSRGRIIKANKDYKRNLEKRVVELTLELVSAYSGTPEAMILALDLRKHAEFGYELLKKIDFLKDSAKIVHTHHDRYDDQGYPSGMAGDDIPLGARIFSVVDALDAMTSRRSYRGASPFEDIVERIAAASGSEYLKQLMFELSIYRI